MSRPSAAAAGTATAAGANSRRRSKRTLQTEEQQFVSAAASDEQSHDDAGPVPKKAKGSRKEGKAVAATSSAAAAAATSSTAAAQPVHLYSDALFSILKFTTLKEQLIFSRVSRSWRQAAFRAPALKAWRASDALPLTDLRDVTRLQRKRVSLRNAEERMSNILDAQLDRLRSVESATAAARLLTALRSVKTLRKNVSNITDRRTGDVKLTMQLPQPAQASAAASAVAAAESQTAQLHVSWQVDDETDDEQLNRWSVHATSSENPQHEKLLFEIIQFDDVVDFNGGVSRLVKWMGTPSLLAGSRRQRRQLFFTFIEVMLDVAGAPRTHCMTGALDEWCQKCSDYPSEPFPPSEPDEEEEDELEEEADENVSEED